MRVAWPAAKAQRPRPTSACASSQELAIARTSSRACRVAHLGLREFSADPVQRPSVVERRGLTTPVADVAVDDQSLFHGLTCCWETTCRQPHSRRGTEGSRRERAGPPQASLRATCGGFRVLAATKKYGCAVS